LRFLDDDDRVNSTLCLMEFALKTTNLGTRPTKR
jgi:hypothetical protein